MLLSFSFPHGFWLIFLMKPHHVELILPLHPQLRQVPLEWLPAFRERGEHFNELRKARWPDGQGVSGRLGDDNFGEFLSVDYPK